MPDYRTKGGLAVVRPESGIETGRWHDSGSVRQAL